MSENTYVHGLVVSQDPNVVKSIEASDAVVGAIVANHCPVPLLGSGASYSTALLPGVPQVVTSVEDFAERFKDHLSSLTAQVYGAFSQGVTFPLVIVRWDEIPTYTALAGNTLQDYVRKSTTTEGSGGESITTYDYCPASATTHVVDGEVTTYTHHLTRTVITWSADQTSVSSSVAVGTITSTTAATPSALTGPELGTLTLGAAVVNDGDSIAPPAGFGYSPTLTSVQDDCKAALGALLDAENELGYKPTRLACDISFQLPIAEKIRSVAAALDAIAIVDCPCKIESSADDDVYTLEPSVSGEGSTSLASGTTTYTNDAAAKKFLLDLASGANSSSGPSSRLFGVYPPATITVNYAEQDVTAVVPASGSVLGLMAYCAAKLGFWVSPSNQTLSIPDAITKMKPALSVPFDMRAGSRMNRLNYNNVNVLAVRDGLRLWGGRTAVPVLNADSVDAQFRQVSVRATDDVIRKSIYDNFLDAVDKNVGSTWADYVVAGVNRFLDQQKGQGAILGGVCWYQRNTTENTDAQITNGHFQFRYKFTPAYVAEEVEFICSITSEYISAIFTSVV